MSNFHCFKVSVVSRPFCNSFKFISRLNDVMTFANNMTSKTIKIFHLANNKLNDIRDVAALKDFKGLSVLKVDGNPFVDKYVDEGHLER